MDYKIIISHSQVPKLLDQDVHKVLIALSSSKRSRIFNARDASIPYAGKQPIWEELKSVEVEQTGNPVEDGHVVQISRLLCRERLSEENSINAPHVQIVCDNTRNLYKIDMIYTCMRIKEYYSQKKARKHYKNRIY